MFRRCLTCRGNNGKQRTAYPALMLVFGAGIVQTSSFTLQQTTSLGEVGRTDYHASLLVEKHKAHRHGRSYLLKGPPSLIPMQSSRAHGDASSIIPRGRKIGEGVEPNGHLPSSLSAATLADMFDDSDRVSLSNENTANRVDLSSTMRVLSAALLITGNTVGAGMMVLPDVAAGPGMATSTALFLGVFCVNLLSGLLIAEVAINQNESSGAQVPSSFKDFADETLQSSAAGNVVSGISVFTNLCVLAFDLMRAGQLASTNLPFSGLNSIEVSIMFSAVLAGLVSTQTNENLSRIASGACSVLFATFACLLLPGLANVHDPLTTFLAPGSSTGGLVESISTAAPVLISAMVFQNIVPSVVKLLDYDRVRSTAAIVLGSSIPMLMYWAWCFAVLGGGVGGSVASGGALLLAFSAATITGSSLACVMSVSEEVNSLLAGSSEDGTNTSSTSNVLSLQSVLLAISPALLGGLIFSGHHDITGALKYAGGYGSPLLYGFLPVLLVWTQRTRSGQEENEENSKNLVPGGICSLGLLGAASAGFVAQEAASDLTSLVSSAVGVM